MTVNSVFSISDEAILNKILLIRGKKVMLDADLGRALWCHNNTFK